MMTTTTTNEEIIRMAREAGLIGDGEPDAIERCFREAIIAALPRFADLVAEATKKKAAKVCEGIYPTWDGSCIEERYAIHAVKECAAAIRSMK